MQPRISTETIATTQAELRERLQIARQKQDRFQEGLTCLELAALALSCSDEAGAEESYNAALSCFGAIENAKYQGETLNLLAALAKRRGNEEESLTLYRRVLTDFGSALDLPARGVSLLEIGVLIFEHGNAVVAQKWFEEALAQFVATHDAEGQVRTRLYLAQLYEGQSNFDAAENEARTAMLLASDHKSLALACEARAALGRLIGLRSPGMGIELLQKALAIAQEKGLTEAAQTCRVALAEAHRREGNADAAYRALADAYASERSFARTERARYQAYLTSVKLTKPRAEEATIAASVEALLSLLKSSPMTKGALGITRVEIDHAKELKAQVGEVAYGGIRDRVQTLLQLGLRSGDILAAEGSSEFVIALPGTTSRQARQISERLRKAVAAADWSTLRPGLSVTLSIGVCISASGSDPEKVLNTANRHLEDARSVGRTAA